MKKSIFLLAMVPFAFASCLEDEGNYDYIELQNVEIAGLPESTRCVLLEQQHFAPNVSTPIPEDRLEYIWRIGADTLGNNKVLEYTFEDVPINNDPLTFEVRDKQTNVRYSKAINLTVVSPFTTGYAILTDAAKLAFQSFESGNPLYQDICEEVKATPLSGEPKAVKQLRYQDGSTGAWYDRISVTMLGGKSPEFDGVSMKLSKYYDDEFRSAPVPQIANITAQYYRNDAAIDVITADGQVYIKRVGSMGSPDDGYFEYPLTTPGGYKLSPWMMRPSNVDAAYMGFDEMNHRFVLWMGNNLSAQMRHVGANDERYSTIPGELLWMGNTLYSSFGYAIVKNNGKYVLYTFENDWQLNPTVSAVELPDGAVNDNCVFATNIASEGYNIVPNYLFIGDGPKLKAINLKNLDNISDAVIEVATFDGDITDMHFDQDSNVLPDAEFSIAVSRNTTSSVYQIDPTIINHGAIIKRFDGIKGRIVSFCRKI